MISELFNTNMIPTHIETCNRSFFYYEIFCTRKSQYVTKVRAVKFRTLFNCIQSPQVWHFNRFYFKDFEVIYSRYPKLRKVLGAGNIPFVRALSNSKAVKVNFSPPNSAFASGEWGAKFPFDLWPISIFAQFISIVILFFMICNYTFLRRHFVPISS